MRSRIHSMVAAIVLKVRGTTLVTVVLATVLLGLLAVSPGLAQTAPGKLAGTWRPHQCSDCVNAMVVTTDSVWVGTLSGGVVRIDRASAAARRTLTDPADCDTVRA